jgi:hypothetical protein
MANYKLVMAHINKLISDNYILIDNEINEISNRLLKKIDESELSNNIKAFIKMWKRVSPHNAKKKFKEAINIIVKDEVKVMVIEHLFSLHEDLIEDNDNRILDETDLLHVLAHLQIDITHFYWVMQEPLENEALRIMTKDNNTLLHTDYLPSSSYDAETNTISYEPSYIEECEISEFHIMAPKVLPPYFKPTEECPICLNFDAVVHTTCVVTMCAHVFHKSCLMNWQKKFFSQKHNKDKTCITCPSCRTDISILV